MSYTRAVAYNTLVQIIGKVITTIISLFLVAALTRYLGVSGYGQYTTIFAFVQFFAVMADFGFFWILVREIAKPGTDVDTTASNILTLRTIIGILVFTLSFLIGIFIPQYAAFKWGIGVVALASLFLSLNSTYVGIFQNRLRMDKAAITDASSRAIILIITLYLIKLHLGLSSILWAYTVGNFINFAMSAYLGRVFIRFRLRFDFDYWRKLFAEAVPMGIVLVLGLIYFKIDTFMLSLMRTSRDVGIYGPPYKVLEILLLLPAMFMGNVFPIVTKYIYQNDERLAGAIQKSFNFLVILGLPIILGVIFTATRIIRIVAGENFVKAHTIPPVFGLAATSPTALQILVIAICLSFISSMFGYLIIAVGKQAKLIAPYLFLVVFNVGMNLILIPRISYIGAAIDTVLTEVLVLFFSWYIAHQYLAIKLNLKIIWQVLFGGLIMGTFLYFFANNFNLIVLIPLAAIIYALSLWVVGALKKQELLILFERENR
ncbi:MAG: flippase [Patescibacteria group bacterium]|jgi:O-antigen/teichoic acid export membrane protein